MTGSMTIDDANETVGTPLSRRGPRTPASLTFDAVGRRPAPADATELDGMGFRLELMDRMPIPQLLITLPRRWAGRDDPSRGLSLTSC